MEEEEEGEEEEEEVVVEEEHIITGIIDDKQRILLHITIFVFVQKLCTGHLIFKNTRRRC